jgi:hypothetical protein
MFICDSCCKDMCVDPMAHLIAPRSFGPCEQCGKTKTCADISQEYFDSGRFDSKEVHKVKSIAHVRVIRQVFQRGFHYAVSHCVEIIRDGKKRQYFHTSNRWRKWLLNNTDTYLFGGEDRIYPRGRITKLGVSINGQ